MEQQIIQSFSGIQLTNEILAEAVELFNGHYGVWGPTCALKEKVGHHVRVNLASLKRLYLPEKSECTYVRVTIDGTLAGQVFACRWLYDGQVVCWITQLVVHEQYRRRGLATNLLTKLRECEDGLYGIMSSQPAACLAAIKAFDRSLVHAMLHEPIDAKTGVVKDALHFIQRHAQAVIQNSPIKYVKTARLTGKLFDSTDDTGAVSAADTDFHVNHAEPLAVLSELQKNDFWRFGDLLDGHEFCVLIRARHL